MVTIKDYLTTNEFVNEAKLDSVSSLEEMIRNVAIGLGNSFKVNIGVGNISFDDDEAQAMLKNSIGHIIENLVVNRFKMKYGPSNVKHIKPKQTVDEGENGACDIVLKTTNGPVNIEVKAYKSISNIKPTDQQWDADYILCVKYNLTGSTVKIMEINVFEPENLKDENGNRPHIKVTRAMIDKGLTVKNY